MKKWVKALNSGEFKQGQMRLYDPEKNSYCCLGVLCDLALVEGVCSYDERGFYGSNNAGAGLPP